MALALSIHTFWVQLVSNVNGCWGADLDLDTVDT